MFLTQTFFSSIWICFTIITFINHTVSNILNLFNEFGVNKSQKFKSILDSFFPNLSSRTISIRLYITKYVWRTADMLPGQGQHRSLKLRNMGLCSDQLIYTSWGISKCYVIVLWHSWGLENDLLASYTALNDSWWYQTSLYCCKVMSRAIQAHQFCTLSFYSNWHYCAVTYIRNTWSFLDF